MKGNNILYLQIKVYTRQRHYTNAFIWSQCALYFDNVYFANSGRERMVVGFITTYAISDYQH